ncbi:TetR/AcrR family transcriptional regulator C-terminal domain-containing protein [Actinoplanes sp. NPDC051633]|uniref:TetR/AcrR family transcriptional regulator n=1 Tax=Actinoplanes sp. NPDC051633 TaxID=3155670 RepID=UPI00341E6F02
MGSRGPKPSLTVDGIAAAGVAIAVAEGLAGVSMQRVAADLGCTKMALYRYLPGKAELVAQMVERSLGAPPDLPADDWRAALRQWTGRLMQGFLAHPWSLPATVGPRPVGPNEIAWTEAALVALDGLPLSGAERLDTVAVLVGHARALAEQATAQLSESGLLAAMAQHAERFPALAAALADVRPGDEDQAFDFGVERILDGLAVLIDRRR